MNLNILYLPRGVNEWTVTRSIATILHSDEFTPRRRDPDAVDRPINFQVKLNPSKAGGAGNDGSGLLTLPTAQIAVKFLSWVKETPLRIEGHKLKFYKRGLPPHGLALTLDKTPYINPDLEEERHQILWALQDKFRVDLVQFGVFYRPQYPSNPHEPLKSRAFSVEWEGRYVTESIAWLSFQYDHKLIRIHLGNEMTDKMGSSIAVNFASIQKIAVGYDGYPYICFDTLTPPVLEEIEFHRTLTGDEHKDNQKYKHRIGSLHPGHEVVAPYAQHLRVALYNDTSTDVINKFVRMCQIAGLASSSIIIRCDGPNKVEADRREFFTRKRLYRLRCEFNTLSWPVAFQLESLLHNRLLHTDEILDLLKSVRSLCERQSPTYVGDLLRRYHERLEVRSPRESPTQCFASVHRDFDFRESKIPPGNFLCCHVTFTPTRMILEGPYPTQSNRVIREYRGYEDHFIRVDFRDEDRLQYRWDREVDGATYLEERVGGILKQGFQLGGRSFEFLAYSTSALRGHSVWFMNPFKHPSKGWVSSQYIRNSLGDFQGTELLQCPSKYAARLAQAFTATDPSVKVRRDQWEEVDDLGKEPHLFTDGVGTISRKLGNQIWASLCAGRRDHGENSVQPSAYQIRFLGYKGVVGVDEQLDKDPMGIMMRLRKSMRKFENSKAEEADIEIAQAFEHPNTSYLNRPLVMLLEDLGVKRDSFIELQEKAVAEARTINDSSAQFRTVLNDHGLGRPYRLFHLLRRIEELGLELTPKNRTPGFDTPFLRQVRQVSMLDALRDIKHSARIPIPESYLLVGVADEGPAYIALGEENVYTLPEGHIFACVQKSPDEEPKWLEGSCSISRSPVVHPGDVQRVRAIGKPPEGMLCLFAHMKNVVVLPSTGHRSLASFLGGGDVDGDLFSIIFYDPLLPATVEEPADYPAGKTFTLYRDSTVDDICDFVVQYINSDLLGLLSDRLLVIADQSKDGMHDENCLWLAELCSQAVDYPKQGIPVDIDNDRLPRTLIRCKPDWHAAEVVNPRHTDYYESSRALGVMYRQITLNDPDPISPDPDKGPQPLTDPISVRLEDLIAPYIPYSLTPDGTSPEIAATFRRYVDELRYICATHTISNTPGVRLLEAEVVAGTILAKCSQKPWRKDRMYRMRLHAGNLVRNVKEEIMGGASAGDTTPAREELVSGLEAAWKAWDFSQRKMNAFGANSFGLIALGAIFDCLDGLGPALPN
ncbi:putative RNA-dependent RNA polymerase 1 [Hypsizygus marmoreus]|uniref:RNA-dependent RNA polymerase n=1 Tax=Hypsizygus marmoreus TaxID=39966 RepID=A0A369JGQ7_HYPMA|nr:putative RNA-dependent RNA polymerase 1 [Hypsizygus marmoreus]